MYLQDQVRRKMRKMPAGKAAKYLLRIIFSEERRGRSLTGVRCNTMDTDGSTKPSLADKDKLAVIYGEDTWHLMLVHYMDFRLKQDFKCNS